MHFKNLYLGHCSIGTLKKSPCRPYSEQLDASFVIFLDDHFFLKKTLYSKFVKPSWAAERRGATGGKAWWLD
jgi:hypothetical protein